MTTLHHVEINISDYLTKSDEELDGILESDFGVPLTGPGVRAYLEECLAKGWKVLPVGNCPMFDYQNGCPGHQDHQL